MVDNAHILLEELALGLSADARVLLVEPSFELLSRVAMANVKELVVINADADPDAPATTTPTGAPLRMRPDWKERPRSKDLIVDAAGGAPKLEIDRILKKAGAYLSLNENPVSRSLPIQSECSVQTHRADDSRDTPDRLYRPIFSAYVRWRCGSIIESNPC